jgi:hypothetical protein
MSDDVSHETRCLPGNIVLQIEQRRLGKRKHVRHGGLLCSGCLENPPAPGQRYCAGCHAAANVRHRARVKQELNQLRALRGQMGESADRAEHG